MPCKFPKYRKQAGTVVACGQCRPCLLKKQREKASRVLLEDRSNGLTDVLFVSLSYSNDHLPLTYTQTKIDPDTGEIVDTVYSCPTGTLRPDHVVKFLKKLRYYASKEKLRLRCVYAGEYGEEKRRPHYHFIIWGLPYKRRELLFKSWTDDRKQLMCDHARLDVQIPRNERHVANYLAKYIITGDNKSDSERLNGAFPEFYRTSKGLGLQYAEGVANALKKESGLINLWSEGKLPSSFFFDGKNFPLDRYMRQKIYALLPRIFQEEIPKISLSTYKEEVLALYENYKLDSSFVEATSHLNFEKTLEEVMRLHNAQRVAEIETRHDFFSSKRRNLDV